MATVDVHVGVTINIGDYESFRADVHLNGIEEGTSEDDIRKLASDTWGTAYVVALDVLNDKAASFVKK